MLITFGHFAITESQKIPSSHPELKDWLTKMSELVRSFEFDAHRGKIEETIGLKNVPDIGRHAAVTYIDAAFRTLYLQVVQEIVDNIPPVGTCKSDKTVHDKTERCEEFVPFESTKIPAVPKEQDLLANLEEFIKACRRFSIQPNRYDFVKWFENGGRRCTWGEYQIQEALEEAI